MVTDINLKQINHLTVKLLEAAQSQEQALLDLKEALEAYNDWCTQIIKEMQDES